MKRLRRLSLFLGPLVALLMILGSTGSIGSLSFASLAATSSCPTDTSAVRSYSVVITRAGTTVNATSLTAVKPGDHVKVNFLVDSRCSSVRLSLVSYKAPSATYSSTTVNQRVVYSYGSKNFGSSGGSLEIDVPNCYFSAVFARGEVVWNQDPSQHVQHDQDLRERRWFIRLFWDEWRREHYRNRQLHLHR